jgi:hypothetical protein
MQMAFTPKDNTGSLWINDRKNKDEHPDRTGSIMVAGTEYRINGRIKKTADGKPFMSLSVRPKAGETAAKPVLDDTIPF